MQKKKKGVGGLHQSRPSGLEPCTKLIVQEAKHRRNVFGEHTFRSLLEAQPAHCAAVAAVAADAGSAAGAGVQRDGPDHQGQGERQVQATRDVHVYLRERKQKKPFIPWRVFLSHTSTTFRLSQLIPCASAHLDKHPLVTEVGKEVSAGCHNAHTRRKLFFNKALLFIHDLLLQLKSVQAL